MPLARLKKMKLIFSPNKPSRTTLNTLSNGTSPLLMAASPLVAKMKHTLRRYPHLPGQSGQ